MAQSDISMAASSTSTEVSSLSRDQWRTVLLASLGGSLEFYDFIIYGIFAQFISKHFFPAEDPYVSLILSFSVLALGYFARPVGGLVIGGIGDRFGRRGVFIASLAVTTLATIGIGLLPSYQSWGLAAPILLVTLRLLQGFCLGGELPGALTFAVEAAPKRVGLACGVIFLCVNTGVLLATFVNLGIQKWLTPDQVSTFGWRIAFLLGGVVGIINFFLRRKLEESPVFLQLKKSTHRFPLADLLRNHSGAVLVGMGVVATIAGVNGILFGYMPAYLTQTLKYDGAETAAVITLGIAMLSVLNIFFGWLSDFVPRRYVLRAGAAAVLLGSIPFGWALLTHATSLYVSMLAFLLFYGIVSGVWSSVLAVLFPPDVRFSGIGASYNFCVTLLSGFAPLIATTLISSYKIVWAPVLYMGLSAAITLIASFFIKTYEAKATVVQL